MRMTITKRINIKYRNSVLFISSILFLLLLLAPISRAGAQVTAQINENNEITIKNNTDRHIVIFRISPSNIEKALQGAIGDKNTKFKEQVKIQVTPWTDLDKNTVIIWSKKQYTFKRDKWNQKSFHYIVIFDDKKTAYQVVQGKEVPISFPTKTPVSQTQESPILSLTEIEQFQKKNNDENQDKPSDDFNIKEKIDSASQIEEIHFGNPFIISPKENVKTTKQEDKVQKEKNTAKKKEVVVENYDKLFGESIIRIEKKAKSYMQKSDFNSSDKEFLKNLQRESEAIREKIADKISDLSAKDKKSLEKLSTFIVRLKKIESEIALKMSKLTFDEIQSLSDRYNSEVLEGFFANLASLSDLEPQINAKENESVFTQWIGKNELLSKIESIEARIDSLENKSEIFITKEREKYETDEDKNVVDVLKNQIPEYKYLIESYRKRLDYIKLPYFLYSITAVLLLLFVFGLLFYMKSLISRKHQNHKKEQEENVSSLVPIDEEDDDFEVVNYTIGLRHLRDKIGSEYYEIDMNTIFKDTAIRYVYFKRDCILDIYKFFNDSLKTDKKTNETGCFIIGTWEYTEGNNKQYNVSLDSVIKPSDDAVYGEYELDFGAKIGISLETSIINLREKTGLEYVHTAWMHSHPGLGLFLSSHDLVAQSQLSYSDHPKRMLAIVLDTNTPDFKTVFFSPKQDGSMNNMDINGNNENPMQILSLETLYQWARNPKSFNNSKAQNYFKIEIESQDAKINELLFSSSAIIDMDVDMENISKGLYGYFYGDVSYKQHPSQKTIVLDDFRLKDDETQRGMRPIACMLVERDFSYDDILRKYTPIINRFDCCAVYEFDKDIVHIMLKNNEGLFSNTNGRIYYVPMMELKKWTRRKR